MNDDLDNAIYRALADILDRAPDAPDAPHDVAFLDTDRKPERPAVLLVAAATVATVGIGGIVITRQQPADPGPASQPGPAATVDASGPAPANSSAPPATTDTPSPPAVRGVPTCGAELPVTVEIPSAPAGPMNGPAVDDPTGEGQFAQHWELPGGTIEIRWPADPREIYDLEDTRGEPNAFDALTVGVPTGGSQAMIKVEHIDPAADAVTDTMTLTATATTATSTPGCAVVQVRYIDHDANQVTLGYDVTDFDAEPAFGVDLNPVIVAAETVPTAPIAADIVECGTPVGTDISSRVAATPAEALVAYLDNDAPPGLMRSGYHELEVADDGTVVYTWSNQQALVTAITVEPTDNGWIATRLESAGC